MLSKNLRPSKAEIAFLDQAYKKFYEIYRETLNDEFWEKDSYYRFFRIKTAFEIYAELLNYEPIKWEIKLIKKNRPPMEGELGSELFKCIRNIFAHFPFFDSWNEVWINKLLINWYKEGQTIDRFLRKYVGKDEIHLRIWEGDKKQMTYLSITFPNEYNDNTQIYLKDIMSEREGVKFSLILMKKIIDTQLIHPNF
ncbi:hypothetical protein P8871_03940 [Bacillus inaquosorum]|uniref:hypothetical protein n=1 Tax=Bacillus inaquosorum TaxID=483913 RepID=UPI002280EC8A|nr:hypothetical protein [Bacillus inaquosorum]MCY8753440.1 hypothetical protein [Bacillus inaquosorum]MCY9343429.1 hypothetical protein [Bacillus inaquosorum]MEC0677956.1 hypothetical protein [Bacillus inaquosorum]MEC3624183.1 hypothetical protein [Bacillus inaquosorum]